MGLSGWAMNVPDLGNKELERSLRYCELMVYLPADWVAPLVLGGRT
jgi:hypothetical protein